MKRYLLFCYDHYYPCGPEGDCVDSYDTIQECIAAWTEDGSDFCNILDLEERVWVGERQSPNYPY